MKREYLEQLVRIYNTLCTVFVRGEDSIPMGDCVKALRELVLDAQQNVIDASTPEMK